MINHPSRRRRHPPWITVRLPQGERYFQVCNCLDRLGVASVCKEAQCPNAAECWGKGTATFMILGKICSRGCRFCAVTTRQPTGFPNPEEPQKIAQAVKELGLQYVIVTSVTRDDLDDFGAGQFVEVVKALKKQCSGVTIELLTPDFHGDLSLINQVANAGAHVIGHNIETTRLQTPKVRDPRCDYQRSLHLLRAYSEQNPLLVIKSSLLVGLGETDEELIETLEDLRAARVDWVTMGQYLQPTLRHLPIQRYLSPEAFNTFAGIAREMGFPLVSAGPLVRSSYRAAEQNVSSLVRKRQEGAKTRLNGTNQKFPY